ncbi:MAG: type II toxin-antitoxin system HicB family antitoxin [bacterium]|nr:type II toxin-antitoxin system HicB family antitoxin [bacterium]
MQKQAKKPKKHSANLHVIVFKEGKKFVSYSPSLDLASQGNTYEEALRMFDEAAELFFEGLEKLGTTEEVLTGLGWKRTTKEGWTPPLVVGHAVRTLSYA